MKQIGSVRGKRHKSIQARVSGLALLSIILLAGILFVYDRFDPGQKPAEAVAVAASASRPPSPVPPRDDKSRPRVEMAALKYSGMKRR